MSDEPQARERLLNVRMERGLSRQEVAGDPLDDPEMPSRPPIQLVGWGREMAQLREQVRRGGRVALTA
ncbi:MAG TPA: hypothetical protein VKR06_09195 [Ktedonosporobacter sp.]|nr:hypothetical protein [Ktedonosporobacter sp.]